MVNEKARDKDGNARDDGLGANAMRGKTKISANETPDTLDQFVETRVWSSTTWRVRSSTALMTSSLSDPRPAPNGKHAKLDASRRKAEAELVLALPPASVAFVVRRIQDASAATLTHGRRRCVNPDDVWEEKAKAFVLWVALVCPLRAKFGMELFEMQLTLE